MKKNFQLIITSIILVSAGIMFGACDHENWYIDESLSLADESHGGLKNGNVVATGDVKNVTYNSATILCSANHNYKESLNIRPGILLTKSSGNFDIYDVGIKSVNRIDIDNFTGSECEVELNGLEPNTKYYYRAFAETEVSSYHYGEIKSFTTSMNFTSGEAVDLGLSVKWANRNIGASQPEEAGVSFCWGAIEGTPSVDFDWHSFSLSTLKTHGYIDDNCNLTPSYDAATQIWGSQWRMPTCEECRELIDKCTWKETTKNGENVYLVTGPNSNYIYIPLYSFWTATAYNSNVVNFSYYLCPGSYASIDYDVRKKEFRIRPVLR